MPLWECGIDMSLLTLYHGSEKMVGAPDLGNTVFFNDFGRGFYTTESMEAALQWACHLGESGFVNIYRLEDGGLNIINLNSEDYTVLNWLALVFSNRMFSLAQASFVRPVEYLVGNFLPDISGADIIRGMRGDEIYFFFAKAFIKGKISLRQLKTLMKLGPLGEQVVLKTEKAFERLEFVSLKGADSVYAYPRRMSRNNNALASFYAEVDIGDEEGIYIGDILRKEMKADDERLR